MEISKQTFNIPTKGTKSAKSKFQASKIVDDLASDSLERRRSAIIQLKQDGNLRIATIRQLIRNPLTTSDGNSLTETIIKILAPYLDELDTERVVEFLTESDLEDSSTLMQYLLQKEPIVKKKPDQMLILNRLLQKELYSAFNDIFLKFYDTLSDNDKVNLLGYLLKLPVNDESQALLATTLPLIFNNITNRASLIALFNKFLDYDDPLIALNLIVGAFPGFTAQARETLIDQILAKRSEYRQAVILPLAIYLPSEERSELISRLANGDEENLILATEIQSLYT